MKKKIAFFDTKPYDIEFFNEANSSSDFTITHVFIDKLCNTGLCEFGFFSYFWFCSTVYKNIYSKWSSTCSEDKYCIALS